MTPPTSPQALARALLLAAEKAGGREWFTDPRPTNAGLAVVDDGASMWPIKCEWPQAEFIALANPSNLTALVTWAMETEARNAELAQALLGMQQAAGLALEALPADQQDGTVGTFLATIHRHCASALSLGHGGDFEASAIAGKQS